MAIKKSDLYSSLWALCDELRGGMDASQRKRPPLTRWPERQPAIGRSRNRQLDATLTGKWTLAHEALPPPLAASLKAALFTDAARAELNELPVGRKAG